MLTIKAQLQVKHLKECAQNKQEINVNSYSYYYECYSHYHLLKKYCRHFLYYSHFFFFLRRWNISFSLQQFMHSCIILHYIPVFHLLKNICHFNSMIKTVFKYTCMPSLWSFWNPQKYAKQYCSNSGQTF